MKIIYCLPQVYKPGGIERIVSIKANYFAEMCNYEVYIITSCQKGLPPYYDFSDKIKFIENIVDNMDSESKEIFIYFYYEQRRIKEISKILNVTESKVKTRLHRIRKTIKKELEKGGYRYE